MEDLKATILAEARKICSMPIIDADGIPKIELYMEQITSFFDDEFDGIRRRDDDKILTKTMINNYTKYDVLPHPSKKKYGKNHMIALIYIIMLKHVLSIQDIKEVLSMIPDSANDDGMYETIYETYRQMLNDHRDSLVNRLEKKLDNINDVLDAKNIEGDDTRLLMFISVLCSEAAVIKLLTGRLIDKYIDERELEEKARKEKEQQGAKKAKEADKEKERREREQQEAEKVKEKEETKAKK